MSRGAASALIVTGLLLAMLVSLIFLLPLLISELEKLLEALPQVLNTLAIWVGELLERYGVTLADLTETLRNQLIQNTSTIVNSVATAFFATWRGGTAFFNYLALIFITPAVTFYILKDWNKIAQTVTKLIPPKNRPVVVAELREAKVLLTGFLKGQFLVSLSLAAFYAIGLTLAGLSFGFGFGIFAGAISAIPLIGALIGFTIVMLVAVFQFAFAAEWIRLGGVAAVLLVGQLLENNLFTPKLVGNRINVHPVWMIFGVLAAGALFGIVGVVLAAPTVAVAGVAVRFGTRLYKSSRFYGEEQVA